MTGMIRIAVHDRDGAIRWHVDGPVGLVSAGDLPEGHSALEVGPEVSGSTHCIVGGVAVPRSSPTTGELAATRLFDLRATRSALLSASDWTQLPDTPMTPGLRASWASYRQTLRDMPSQPAGTAWPTKPQE